MIRLLFLLCLSVSLYGQKWVKPLAENHGYPLGKKYLQIKEKGFFTVYFINTTDKNYSVDAENGRIKPTAQIKDVNGEWKSLYYDSNPCLDPQPPFKLNVLLGHHIFLLKNSNGVKIFSAKC